MLSMVTLEIIFKNVKFLEAYVLTAVLERVEANNNNRNTVIYQ